MKKIGLLTTLLVAGLLLTGCNNNVHYEEEFSEYGLVHWPNGTITLEDFEKEGNILIELNIEQCNTPEKACVPVIVKEDGKLYTPYEYNETPYDDKKDRYTYYTDLETFHKVTGLKEATSEYVEGNNNVYFFDPYVKFYKTNEEREAILKEKIENQTIEEPVSEESEIGRNSINLGEELLGNEEGVIFEPKKWKGQMPCIGGCDNGKDEEYVEGWYYEYTNPSLGIKITTPDGKNGNWNNIFLEKRETPLFLLSGNAIYSLEYIRDKEEIEFAEFIKGYKKNPEYSLEELLDRTYSSSGCNLRKYNIEQSLGTHFKGVGEYYYEFVSNNGNVYNDCISEEGEDGPGPIIFIESKDGEKFYKIRMGDGCAPGPCSIFGKVEIY